MSMTSDSDDSRLKGDPAGQDEQPTDTRETSPDGDTETESPSLFGDDDDHLASDSPVAREGKAHLWLIAAALVTAITLVLVVAVTGIYDPYRCQTHEQCRGLNRCIEGHCMVPEIWMNEVDSACRQALGLERSCFSAEAWERIE